MKYFVLIPARYHSSRLPQKSLARLGNESLIEHVFKRCELCQKVDEVFVLTDHEDIKKEVNRFSPNVLLTSTTHPSGTDRVFEGASLLGANDDDFIVNIQGDQALLDPLLINDMIACYEQNKHSADMFTFARETSDENELASTGCVKVTLSKDNMALYFSRSLIPHLRETEDKSITTYYKHLGIYGYTFGFLRTFVGLEVGNLEQIERLEQLRAMENGYKIKVITTDKQTVDVDYPQDLRVVNEMIEKNR